MSEKKTYIDPDMVCEEIFLNLYFIQHESEAHIIAKWIAFAGMKDMESIIPLFC